MASLPRPLLRKHNELAHELQTLEAQANQVRAQLQTVDGAIRLLDPRWKPPKLSKKRLPVQKGRLPPGEAARLSLMALKGVNGGLTTPDIVDGIAKEKSLTFTDRQDREDFASSVAMALRRYQRRGLVTSEPIDGTNKQRWALKRG